MHMRVMTNEEAEAMYGDKLNPGCCSATKPCDHQKKSPYTVCEKCSNTVHMELMR
jgi:hypothetical protein